MRLRVVAGSALLGYGLLVVLGVLPHDALWAGLVATASGVLLLATQRNPATGPGPGATPSGQPLVPRWRRVCVASLGAAAAGGVVAYNLAMRSGMSWPEWAILAYGVLLLAAAPALGRSFRGVRVDAAVGWSFALVLAPLGLFAVNAALSTSSGAGTAATPLVHALIVEPTAFALRVFGTPVRVVGDTLMLRTQSGWLALGVGLVCAGLYPMVLFGGLWALHSWQARLTLRHAVGLLVTGLAGLWVVNLLRLVLIAKVGQRWGADALQTAHANLGWLLFVAFTVVFWGVALRKKKAPVPVQEP